MVLVSPEIDGSTSENGHYTDSIKQSGKYPVRTLARSTKAVANKPTSSRIVAMKSTSMDKADPSSERQALASQQALDLGLKHHNSGDLSNAESIYQQILKADPKQPVALHLLGVVFHEKGDSNRAIDLIKQALTVKPDYAEALCNLGIIQQHQGQLEEAVASYHKTLAVKPDFAEAHYNFGNVLQEMGQLEKAIASFQMAVDIKPDYADALNNLGTALKERGQVDVAVACYRKALDINPGDAEIHNNLGIALRDMGKPEDAFECHQHSVALVPFNELFWGSMAETLESLSFTSVDDSLLQVLCDLLEKSTTAPSSLSRPIIRALRHHRYFSQILDSTGSEKTVNAAAYRDISERLSQIPLLLQIMQLSPIYDLEIERLFTRLRRELLLTVWAAENSEEPGLTYSLAFSVALALHCFVNDYIFPETDEETVAAEHLGEHIAALVTSGQELPPMLLVALAAFRPLYCFPWAKDLHERNWPRELNGLIVRQIQEPLAEIALRDQIPKLSTIENAVSMAVRDQYEENPFPRWIKMGLPAEARTIKGFLQGPPLRLDLGDYVSPESPNILIAGCGTGQHSLNTASRFPHAQVLAVDLSLSSLSFAVRKTKELGLSNIEYAQADIMNLGDIGRQFDLIESIGVLHHLENPLAGWRVLVNLLRPGGLMKIGLYSEKARQDVAKGRELIAKRSYANSPEDIRSCRQDVIAMGEDGNQAMSVLSNNIDFFSLSNCRDLLFHVQEHCFTLPQIEEDLQALNLKFLGFEMRNQQLIRTYRDSHREKQALISLSHWHQFELENPETFRAMYQFWCKKL